jgi:hypothetical protein
MHGDELTIDDALKVVAEGLYEYWQEGRSFHLGDHWQDGLGWIGPQPDNRADEDYKTVMASIQKAFVSKNVIAEVIKRHRNAVLGTPPAWAITTREPLETGEEPSPEDQALIAEAEMLLTDWWDKRQAYSILQDAVVPMLYAGRITLRLFIPHERRIALEDGSLGIPMLEQEEALKHIFLDVPDPDAANVHVDKDNMEPIGVYVYKAHGLRHAEISYLDEDDNTVLRVLTDAGTAESPASTQDGQGAEVQELRFPTGGHLWMYSMKRDPLITPQAMQLQKLLNLAFTMMGRNVVQAGFLERLILNAQVPGHWEGDDVTEPRHFVPDEMFFGAGTTNMLQGVTIEDDVTGRVVVANPSVVYRDPVPVTTFTQTKQATYISILEETHQLHAFISGDATASGESRVQARADFRSDLELTAPDVGAAVRWLLEALLAVAGEFSGQPGKFDRLRADVNVRVNPGPLSPDEKRVILEQYKEGVWSLQKTLTLLGEEDVAAELARLAIEGEQSLEQLEQRVDIMAKIAAITGIEAAALTAGFDEKVAKKLAQMAEVVEEKEAERAEAQAEAAATNESTVNSTGRRVPANNGSPR